jgi:amino-acid N-acetyltransferase
MNNAPLDALDTPINASQFVHWLRTVAPYIHAFRGKTMVIAFGGELAQAQRLSDLAYDLALLHAMGMRIVLVHGSQPQVQEQLALRNCASQFINGIRVTDATALECAKEASGELSLDIEAAFSQGLPNTPMAHAEIRLLSGNFVTARPMGIIDGVDYQHTGLVRKVAGDAIKQALSANAIVLLSPLGFSPTGEAFNLSMEDVASSVAIAIKADKLIFITEFAGITKFDAEVYQELDAQAAENVLKDNNLHADAKFYLAHALKACRNGVNRAHIIPFALDGSVLMELFTHDGVGTMITQNNLESLREANLDDVGGILSLIEPLEADGTLVPRGRALIERDIELFSVIEHDGVIFGCALLQTFEDES